MIWKYLRHTRMALRWVAFSSKFWGAILAIIALPLVCPNWGSQPNDRASAAEVDAEGVLAPVGFADIVARVKPTVVRVRAKIAGVVSSSESQSEFPSGTPFDQFFRQFGMPVPTTPAPQTEVALGSGFFISGDGYIVTNNHVVAHGENFEVTTDDGKTYPAKVIGTDPQTDPALIKVSAQTDFSYVRFAEAEPRIGDWVLPVGNPFGLGGTVTAGIVSARGRDIGAGPYDDFIQIDAPVNKGNSGGPSFNVKGEVIGVNTAIYSPSGGSVGVAFDIPAETVKLVVAELKEHGHVTRGWIGVQIQLVTPAIADALGLKKPEGALVSQLQPNSPAGKSGVEIGDVITSVNGQAVKDSRDLARKIAVLKPGTATRISVFRDGKEKTLTVILGELPASAQAKVKSREERNEQSTLGLTLAPASAVAGAGDHGVVVTGIDPNSRAAESGIETGDVILEVGRQVVDTPAEVQKMIDEAQTHAKHAVLMRIRRGDMTSFVAVPIGQG